MSVLPPTTGRSIRGHYPINEIGQVVIAPEDLDGSWDRVCAHLATSSDTTLTDWGRRILRQGLDADVRSVVVEPHYVCKDHSNLHNHFYSKKFVSRSVHASRLHFFDRPDVDMGKLVVAPETYQEAYLGYSVIRPVADRCLGRTVIDPFKLSRGKDPNFYVLQTPFRARIFGPELTVEGFPYTSQDIDATLCGQTALWSICRYLSERYPQYGELLPYELIALTHREQGRIVPHRGMTYRDYAAILSELGAHPIIIKLKDQSSGPRVLPERFQDLCAYLESGVPVLASFNGHAAALIGHTLDYDRPHGPLTEGWLIDHSSFFGAFVANDDNHFPYTKITYNPYLGLGITPPERGAPRQFIEDMLAVVCPLPEKVYLPAALARIQALNVIELHRAAIQSLEPGPHVIRLFFTTSPAFKRRKIETGRRNGGRDVSDLFAAYLHLPHFIWVMEVSPLAGYRRGTCCAEVVLDATAGSRDNAMIYSRVGCSINHQGEERAELASSNEFPSLSTTCGANPELTHLQPSCTSPSNLPTTYPSWNQTNCAPMQGVSCRTREGFFSLRRSGRTWLSSY